MAAAPLREQPVAQDARRVRGTLHLLAHDGSEKGRFVMSKITTSLGRALSNDVRLLLEDVSRLHCSIVFDKENHATLHIYGANGVWHNHSLLKPQDRNTCVSLADGDQLKISKHLLRFAYGTPYEEKEEGMVSQAEDIQDTTCVPGEDNVPSPSSSYLENDVTPTPTQDEAEQDPELPACTAPLGEQLGNLSVSQTSATTDSHEGHGTAQTNLIPEKTYNEPAPSATSTPRRARRASHLTTTIPRRQSARLKARASLPSMRSAWTPEHAKRPVLVSQHVDIPEKDTTSISTVDGTQNLSASLPQEESMTSSSIAVQESDKARDPTLEDMDQKNMDLNSSSYLAYDESDAPSSDDEEEAEVEKSLELSTEVGTTPSPKPKPLGPHFLTPQADKPTKVETRRLSDIQATKENDKRTPMPCHRSSWQWLRNMLSPSSLSAESEAESKAEDMEAREYPSMMDTSDVVPEGENTRDDEETDKTPKVAEPEEVAEEVAEEPVSNTSIEAGRSTLAVECLQEKKPEPPTPDMRVLKHMFSEPRPVAGVDTALSDFRHLI
ncbi:fha domain-containing protein [Malassezia pachydermatis]|uniref:Fha domain-containing protein n=1 Tax=Malassezia pachydermatis TaxID=77020 RepID=A0A0M8MT22_9BASI|nr:fha domain-containing protein [Malassezia pachydermatis]KOS13210.1 fha domain-containing protein [Malassezia pachydermatis]